MFGKILVGVDGSRYAGRAVDTAIALAKLSGASVTLLHVIRNLSLPPEILEMMAKGEVTESRMELLQDSAEIILETAREKFLKAGLTHVQTRYLIGTPSASIAKYAEENEIDLIVIGDHGISCEDENMLGGVARKLTNIARVSCLVVK